MSPLVIADPRHIRIAWGREGLPLELTRPEAMELVSKVLAELDMSEVELVLELVVGIVDARDGKG